MRRTFAIIAACGTLALLSGCGKSREPMSAAEVRTMYGEYFVYGIDYGLHGRIKARAIDPQTGDLLDVQIEEIDKRILHADRGEIVVNAATDSLTIRLVGVTAADIETGQLTTAPMFLTEEIPLDFDVTD